MCVIVYTEINGKQILAKNRDRTYKPEIEIVHEIVNGIEVAYIRDKYTGWIEGMNENGVGLVNSTLSLSDGKILLKKNIKGTQRKVKESIKKNNVMYKALINKHIDKNFYDIIKHTNKKYVLEGHTLLFHKNHVVHIENNKENHFIVEKVNKTSVFANHGIRLKDEGYIEATTRRSTFLRRKIIQDEFNNTKVKSIEDLTDILNRNYSNINPRFHPYRDKYYTIKKNKISPRKKFVSTTGQLVLNMTDKEFNFYTDIHNAKNVTYVNKLAKDYAPKIRINIHETEKRLNPKKKIFTQKYLNKIYERFDYEPKRVYEKTRTMRKTRKNTNTNTNTKTRTNK